MASTIYQYQFDNIIINVHIYQLMHISIGIGYKILWIDIIHKKSNMVCSLQGPCTLLCNYQNVLNQSFEPNLWL
jgi:predicted transglutaminase-like protease